MAVARLGYEIDSSGAVKAAADLDKMSAAATKAERGAKTTAAAAAKFGGAMKSSAAQTANLGAQLNDIGVMLAAGQSPLQLAVQQGTQINQVFAQMGGGKAALRGLAAGFMSMVNPMSLATIGIIAGGAALVQWGIAAATAGDNGKELADAMRDIEESTRNAKLELMAMQMGLAGASQVLVQQEINSLETQRARTVQLIAQFEADVGREALRLSAQYKLQLKDIDAQLASKRKLLAADKEVQEALEQQNYLLEQANMFREAQQRLRNEAGAKLEEMIQLEAALNKELGDGAAEILKAAGVDLKNIDEAARRAASLAASMGIAFQEAYALANVDFSPLGGGLTPNMPNLLPTKEELTGTKVNTPSGVGGGASRVDTFARDLEALRESLRTESEVLTEWKSEQDAILANDRAMEILGIQGHNEAKLRLEKEYQERLAEVKEAERGGNLDVMSDFFGEAAGLMQSGNEKLFKIGKAAAVANAIVNGHSAAVAAWDKGMQAGGPPLAAAFTALSVAKTAAQISSLKSASFGGGGGSGGGTSAGVTASAPEPQRRQTRAIISVQSGRSRFTIEEMNDIARGLQDLSEEGVIIEGFTRA